LGKAACSFKECDVTRLLRAAKKAGVSVRLDVDLERRRMSLTPVELTDGKGEAGANDWDSIYEQS
jgi:hypothetical protein